MANFTDAGRRYLGWIAEEALPRWAGSGFDSKTGGSIERFLPDGSVDAEANLRVRVQARQLFVFAVAAEHGWIDSALTKVQSLNQFMQQRALRSDAPGYVHLLSPTLQVIDRRVDLYDYAFFLLSRAWHFRATREESSLEQATAIMAFLDDTLASPAGGWVEGNYAHSIRRQNPHMHLLESFLALAEVDANPIWLERADQVIDLFERHFFLPDPGVLLEYFQTDFGAIMASDEQRVEPGHLLEWVWLLRWYQQLRQRDMSSFAEILYSNARRFGLTSDSGLMVDELDSSGAVLTYTKRLWPMTEYIKASICEARAGNVAAEGFAAEAIESLMNSFISGSASGTYIDRLDELDRPCDEHAPASSMYHLVAAAIEVDRWLRAA